MTQEHPELPTPPPDDQPATAPVLRQPRWSGKKTAVVAALAIGLSSAGAISASAAVASGTGGGMGGRMGGGGFGDARTFEGGLSGAGNQNGTTGNSVGSTGNSDSSGSGGNGSDSNSGRTRPSGLPSGAPNGAAAGGDAPGAPVG